MNLWHKVNTKMEHKINRLISSGLINLRNNLLLKFKSVYSKVLVSSVKPKGNFPITSLIDSNRLLSFHRLS